MRTLLLLIEQSSKPLLWGIATFALLIIGVMDYWTGFELSFSIFYLLPVTLVAWGISRRSGFIMSLVSAALWLATNRLAGLQFSQSYLLYWNALTRLGFFMVVASLLAEQRLILESERQLARTDPLTKLLNHRAFYHAVNMEVQRFKRYHCPFALLYLDLDNFKTINNQWGHHTGDVLLSIVSDILSDCLRETDLVARIGVDEFAALLHIPEETEVKHIVARLQKILLEEMEKHQWPVTCSMGVLIVEYTPNSIDELIQAADKLMYTAKSAGKNAVAYANGNDTTQTVLIQKSPASPKF
ncbi:GGDEF domain-containing protein [Acaryochloris marina]|uniref:GGDEF domain-containing protein n=1 Tax=Acaryochloris marina TaxID=155978 RepID=UPI001BAEF252|nr:GGDEF domain-containing protein [Acaryochloris marina]QUY45495.1 GGDEF domain-containing protein [Acaryochloris marina S15]